MKNNDSEFQSGTVGPGNILKDRSKEPDRKDNIQAAGAKLFAIITTIIIILFYFLTYNYHAGR